MKLNFTGFLLLLFLFTDKLNAQISIDPNLQLRFEQTRKSFPSKLLEEIEDDKTLLKEIEDATGVNHGEAFFTKLDIHTLNYSELKFRDYSGIEILSLNGLPPVETTTDSLAFFANRFKLTEGELINGGLLIHISLVFGENFRLEIYGDSISAHFAEIYWDVPTLALSSNDTFTDRLEIPVALKKMELNTKDFRVGDVLYGYCEMETAVPYYQTDSELDGQFLKLSKKFAFYFKVPINKNSGHPINRW